MLKNTFAILAAFFSAGAALVSILTFAKNQGWLAERILPADGAVGWVRVTPGADTIRALGDTVHFAATVIDTLGAIVVMPGVRWTTSDSAVARARPDGGVAAVGPGEVTVTASVGKASGQARLLVRQVVAALVLDHVDGMTLAEGSSSALTARPLDARGRVVTGRAISWHSADPSIVTLDSTGRISGVTPGAATVTASVDGLSASGTVTVTPVLARLSVQGPALLHAMPGRALDPVVVRALSRQGRPMAGVPIALSLNDIFGVPVGALAADTVRTDSAGVARIGWTAGQGPGRQRLTIRAAGLDSAAVVDADVEPVAANTRLALLGPAPSAGIGDTLPAPVAVQVTDSAGRPLADVPVSWTSLDGAAIVSLAPRTDSAGTSRARWVLGARAGVERARVTAGNGRLVPPLVVSVRVGPGKPVGISVLNGDGQRGRAGHTLPAPVTAVVVDRAGNPVPGQRVLARPASGEVTDSAPVTDAAGRVSVRWMLGTRAGPQRLELIADGAAGVHGSAAAVGIAGPAVNVTFAGAPTGAIKVARLKVTALVTDAFGNPVPKVALRAATTSGTVAPSEVVTDEKGEGRFSWSFGAASGELKLNVRGLGVEARGVLVVERGAAAPPAPKRRR